MQAYDDERISPLYQLGEKTAEYGHERRYFSAFGGWSAGLSDGWVRRFTAGAVYDDNQFADSLDPALALATPDDRKFVYPYMGIEILQDQYEKTTNRDQIDKTEDFLTGTRFTASLGWSDESFGADRDALLYSLGASRSFGDISKSALLVSADASGRLESGDTVNALTNVSARYYRQLSEKQTVFATFLATHGNRLDLGQFRHPLSSSPAQSPRQINLVVGPIYCQLSQFRGVHCWFCCWLCLVIGNVG